MRIGYLIGPKDFIDEAARLRRIIDRQGDTILEQTLAKMIMNGDVQRHCNKVLRIYKERRDLFCQLCKEKLSAYFDFEIPNGGMAIWIRLHKKYCWDDIVLAAKEANLLLNHEWKRYDNDQSGHNGIRIGFASLNLDEIREVIDILVTVFKEMDS